MKRRGDVDLAKYLIGRILQRTATAPVFTRGTFYKYDPQSGVWQPWATHLVLRTILALHRKQAKLSNHLAAKTLDNMRTLCADPSFFDRATTGVAFKNGFAIVSAGKIVLKKHNAAHRARFGFKFRYKLSVPNKLLEFVDQVWQPDRDKAQKIAFLQEFLGACMLGVAPRFEKAVVLYGREGRNGKSILLEAISELFPPEARSAVAPQKWNEEYYAAELMHARFNSVSEIPKAAISNGTLFKAVVSGDEIVGRPIREAPIKFRPQAGHIFAGNYLPTASDVGPAFWRRWMVLTFNRTFSGQESKHKIVSGILAEAPELAGWALQGAARLLEQGHYTTPDSAETAVQAWALKADQVKAFLLECVEPGVKGKATTRETYDAYKSWSIHSGHALLSKSTFNDRMEQLGHYTKRGKTSNVYNFTLRDKQDWGAKRPVLTAI